MRRVSIEIHANECGWHRLYVSGTTSQFNDCDKCVGADIVNGIIVPCFDYDLSFDYTPSVRFPSEPAPADKEYLGVSVFVDLKKEGIELAMYSEVPFRLGYFGPVVYFDGTLWFPAGDYSYTMHAEIRNLEWDERIRRSAHG